MIPPLLVVRLISLFLFNATATTDIYTLSLHDALPILVHEAIRVHRKTARWTTRAVARHCIFAASVAAESVACANGDNGWLDRKSTRLNSSHGYISYAVFCLKKKITNPIQQLI